MLHLHLGPFLHMSEEQKQYIEVGTVRMFIEPSAKHEQSLG